MSGPARSIHSLEREASRRPRVSAALRATRELARAIVAAALAASLLITAIHQFEKRAQSAGAAGAPARAPDAIPPASGAPFSRGGVRA